MAVVADFGVAKAVDLAAMREDGAWTVRNGGMRVVKAGQVTSIATTNALEFDPVISPNGLDVAYVAGAPGSSHVLVRQLAGERATALVKEFPGEQLRPAWSRDGSLVAFITNGVAYSVPSSGGAPKVLVETPDFAISEVALSPDGERIAFVNTTGLWIKPAGAGDAVQLLPGQTLHSIAWSPDGTRIAFIDGIAAGLENMSAAPINVITIAGGKIAVIAKGDVVNLSPVWAPDGRSLFYTSNRQGTLDIYQQFLTRDAQPRGLAQRITVGLSARRISLSKDGSHVAYDVVRSRSNIWTVDIGSGVASMTAARQVTSDNQRIESLSLSHDGQWLAYDSDLGGNPISTR
ncbi:MAG: hypothetical protein JWM95_1211 [Gemmatimonadetes bacterium]|nr:hypothetical protein [Gemmatimonadota bacterium]